MVLIPLLVAAAALTGLPVAAAALVSLASRREEARWSLGRPAQDLLQTAARRVIGFHSDLLTWQKPKSRAQNRRAQNDSPAPPG